MKFERIRIERAPGIDQPFELTGLKPGFNVVLGPNGSGKSLVCRVVRDLLWNTGKANGTSASAQIAVQTGSMEVRCDEEAHEWRPVDYGAQRPLLPSQHSAGCFILHAGDLLSIGSGTDREIANEVKKQMAGGYDLDALCVGQFQVTPQHGKKARRALDGAQKELNRVQEEFRSLGAEEESLAGLDRSIQIAREAAEQVRVFEVLGQLANERATLAELGSALAALPEGMQYFSGAEGEKLVERDESLARSQTELADVEVELASKVRKLTGLGAVAIESTLEDVAAWYDRARKLAQLEEHCARCDEEARVAAAEAREAASQLGAERNGSQAISPSVALLDQLDKFIRACELNRAALAVTGARLQLLAQASEGATSRDVERALESLREWIAYPFSPNESARKPWLWALGAVGLGVGAWYARLGEPRWLTACGAGAVLWVWAYVLGAGARSGELLRAEAQGNFPLRDVEPPEAWEPLAVRTRLLELESEISDAHAEEDRARDRTFLEKRLAQLEEAEDELEVARGQFAEGLGLDADVSSLALVEVARRLANLRRAELSSRESEERALHSHAERAGKAAALVDWLDERGLKAIDATDGIVALRELEERVRTAARLAEEVAVLEGRRPRLMSDISMHETRVAQVFVDSALGDDDRLGLEQRLAALAEYRRLEREHAGVAAQVARLVGLLPESEEELGSVEVGEALLRVEETSAGLQALLEDRATARERLSAARSGTRMEDALDQVASARERFEEQHEQALDACVGKFLIDEIGEEYRQSSSPEVLKRAAALFGRFTHHRYELQLDDAGNQSRFHARDVQRNRMLELDQLSDGTRMQLLLAARFAYALEVEEECVPFFLDEALSFSDPKRLGEIAQVLFALVSEGRQVIYLTSRPAEIDVFRRAARDAGCEAPQVLDLAAARGLGAVATEPSELDYEIVPVPAPVGNDSPLEYGVRLGVPLPTPESTASGLHLFYLLREELPLLRELIAAGCTTLGQWQANVRLGAARALCTDDQQREALSERTKVAQAVFESWRIGRGKQVTRRELLACGSVSERYLDGLAEIASESGGLATAFLAVLEARQDERVKGFQKKKLEELAVWLEEHEFLDRRPCLELEAARAHVLAERASSVRAGRLTVEDVNTLTASIWSALEQGEAKQQSRKMSAEAPPVPEGA